VEINFKYLKLNEHSAMSGLGKDLYLADQEFIACMEPEIFISVLTKEIDI